MLEIESNTMKPMPDTLEEAIACALEAEAVGRPDAELWLLEVARLRDRMANVDTSGEQS